VPLAYIHVACYGTGGAVLWWDPVTVVFFSHLEPPLVSRLLCINKSIHTSSKQWQWYVVVVQGCGVSPL